MEKMWLFSVTALKQEERSAFTIPEENGKTAFLEMGFF